MIRLAIVGCGGMGHRHLYGLTELQRIGRKAFELVGVYDPVRASAESLADQAAERLGKRPVVTGSLAELADLGVEAVDVTTTPPYHHSVAIEALQRGWHTMLEKPMGLTVRACNLVKQAAQAVPCVFSVAENYRRDPINRLAKALLEAGVIGRPRLFMQHSFGGGGNLMVISVWRHQKDQSGLLLDVGVHYTDMMEYFLGEVESVYAQTRLHEPIRRNPVAEGHAPTSNPSGVYGRWQKEMPAQFEATAEDAAYATLLFKNGAAGQYIEDHASHGQSGWYRQIYGSAGSMTLPGDRSGGTISLNLEGKVIEGEKVLDLLPDFHLDEVTTALFGAERLWRYGLPFAQTDRKIIAIEYADFAEAIQGNHTVEVGADQGTRAVAISYAFLESGLLGQPVSIEAVLNEQVDGYQREINEGLGL
jgi:predicted dehydrogenase